MYLGVVLVGVLVCGGCSNPESSGSGDPDTSRESRTALTKDQKAAKAARALEAQLVAPPADVVAALGAEVYPGAKVMNAMKALRSEIRGTVMVDYMFFVNDAPDKVRDFYEGKLAGSQRGPAMMEKLAFVVKGTNSHGEAVVVQALGQGGKTTFHFVITKTKRP